MDKKPPMMFKLEEPVRDYEEERELSTFEKVSFGHADYRKAIDMIKALYLEDDRVFTIGFSAGKDSTCVVDLCLTALMEIPELARDKKVWILLSKTGQDLDPMDRYINSTIKKLKAYGEEHNLPLEVHVALPEQNDTFWLNIIGRGMVLPTSVGSSSSGWCVSRLKTTPQAKILNDSIFSQSGKVDFVSLTGTRADEGASRKKRLKEFTIDGAMKKHSEYPNSAVLAPIEFWSTKDVWNYIINDSKDWFNTDDIVTLYASTAGEGKECSTVLDAGGAGNKPGCAASGGRFGCWGCTKMKTDTSAVAMSQHEGYEYLKHRQDFRLWLTDFAEGGWEGTRDVFSHGKRGHIFRAYTYTNSRTGLAGVGGLTLDFRKQILDNLLSTEQKEKETKEDCSLLTDYELNFIAEVWFWYGDLDYTAAEIANKYGKTAEHSDTLVKMVTLAKMLREENRYLEPILSFKHDIHTSDRFYAQFIMEFIDDKNPNDLSRAEDAVSKVLAWAAIADDIGHIGSIEHYETCPVMEDVGDRFKNACFLSPERERSIREEWTQDKPFKHTEHSLQEKGLLSDDIEVHVEAKQYIEDNRFPNDTYDFTNDNNISMEEQIAFLEESRDTARDAVRAEAFPEDATVSSERFLPPELLARKMEREREEVEKKLEREYEKEQKKYACGHPDMRQLNLFDLLDEEPAKEKGLSADSHLGR